MKLNNINEAYFRQVLLRVLLVYSFTNRWRCLFLYFGIFYVCTVATI